MKKMSNTGGCRLKFPPMLKLLTVMKLSIILVSFVSLGISFGSTYAQNTQLSIQVENESIKGLFRQIEDQTEFSFMYDNTLLDLEQKVSLSATGVTVDQVLDQILNKSEIRYQIIDRHIVLIPANTTSQDRTITGKVISSEDSEGLPGVNVILQGTSTGTVTDVNGMYSLSIPDQNAILVFSSVGYMQQEISVENQSVIDIAMTQDITALDEIVVVGYGTQKKKDVTGSISSVSGKDIYQPSTASFDQMLQGQVAGVQISQTSGAPGGNVNVLIRGISSITGGNQPLYVIDGYPVGTTGGSSDMSSYGANTYSSSGMASNVQSRVNPLSAINPSDIESIEVLKDASATAIYGSRGANGVIIITTKRGSVGKTKVSLDVSYGVQEVANKIDLMNSQEYAAYVADARDNARVYVGGSADDPNESRAGAHRVRPEFRNPESITTDTDWQDVIFQTAPVQNYQASINGGGNKVNYFISGGYYAQEGIVKGSNYDRFNLRTNIDAQISDKLKIATTIAGSYGFGDFVKTEGHYGQGGVLAQALTASPTIPVYDDEGNYFFDQADVTDGLGWLANPLTLLDEQSDERKLTDFFNNTFVEYTILDGLTLKSSIGINYNTEAIKLWRSSEIPNFTNLNYPSNAGASKSQQINWLNENSVTYKRIFNNKHNLTAVAAYTIQKDSYELLTAGASDFPTDYVTYISAGIVNAGSHVLSEWSIMSLLARVNYSYDGKYLLTGTVRRDGSSRFGSNKRWGTFPSFSVGYVISEEQFMQSAGFINSLKLRASYGLSGNNQIGNYTHIGLLSNSNYVENNSQRPGLVPSNLSNDDLTWEKSKQVNLGLDLSLFDSRFNLTMELYRDTKTDLLLAVQLPAASGFNSSTQNIGDIENRGFELGLKTINIKSNKFEWSTNLTFTQNENEVLKIATEGGRIQNSSYQITEVGSPIASFFMQNAIGVYKTNEEVTGTAIIHPRVQAGDLIFEDVNNDGKIDSNDRKIVGDPWPDFTWGFDNRFTLGNLSLNISLAGSQGGQSFFQAGTMILNSAGVQNQLATANDRWKSESDPGAGVQPRAIRNNYANGFGTSSRFLFDNSFVRIRNINLSYTFPQDLVSKLSMSGMQVFANVINLHTWTDYPGYDPESSTAGNNVVNTGIDFLTYPLARTFTLGLNITF
jgi:TonB-linked SusC/RagA family outer membrane protein